MSTNLKDTKIFIPEIPVHWENRIRVGHTNIWNEVSLDPENYPTVTLEPPKHGLYAERFPDSSPAGWYWICGCMKCLGVTNKHSYVVCHEHDRCESCNTHRDDLNDMPIGTVTGFVCKPCVDKEKQEKKDLALMIAERDGHSELDCYARIDIICPRCASFHEVEEPYSEGQHDITCNVCDEEYVVDVEYVPLYTTSFKEKSGDEV